MINFFEKSYRKIPSGYLKSIIKNVLSFCIHQFPFGIENLELDGEKIKLYKDRTFNNKLLLSEVKRYNLCKKIKKGDIVIDGGAYSGLFTIFASKKTGNTGKVIAFEPDPYNYIILKRNLDLNKVKNALLIKKGLYSKNLKLPFDIQGISSCITSFQTNQKTINKIDAVSLDSELKNLKINKVDFVKMDIEGAEIETVNGCKKLIKNNNDIHFAIASYHMVNGRETLYYLDKFFKKLKMKVKTVYENGQSTTYAGRKLISIG